MHLASPAGIGQAALADITAFVTSRTRNLFNPAVTPSVLAAAATVQGVSDRQLAGVATDADVARAEAHAFGVQATVIGLVLRLVSRIFEVSDR